MNTEHIAKFMHRLQKASVNLLDSLAFFQAEILLFVKRRCI